MKKYIFLLFYMILSTVNAQALTVNDVQKDVICSCGCGMVLESCNCGTADRMRNEIREMINQGMSKEEIIEELQAMYGKEVLANPPKEGIFIGLWYYPVFAVGIGVAIIYVLLRRRNAEWYADPDEVINEEEYDLEH